MFLDNIYNMEEEGEECKIELGLAIGSTHGEYPIPRDHKLHILFPPRPPPITKEEEEERRGPKRPRSVTGDEEEEDSVGRDDKGGGGARKKLRLTQEQATLLEDTFREHKTLSSFQKQELAEKLNLKPRQVEVWFQNRRARNKLKQTEVDFQLLKKWCDTLNEENRRLKKELQELKLVKQQPEGSTLYLGLPKVASEAMSLALCPSCCRTTTMASSKKSSSGDSSIAC